MISAFGPLHDRQAPPPGRQRAARRHSRPLSGSQRAFQTRGCTPGYPPKSEKVPVNAVSQCRRPRPVRRTGACLTAIERARERSLGCCSEPTTAPGHRATGRVRGSSSSRRSAVAPAISAFGPLQRPPSTAISGRQWAARRHSRPLSGPLAPSKPAGVLQGTPRNPKRCPSTPFLSAAVAARSTAPASLPRTTIRHRRSVGVVAPSSFTTSLTQTPPPAMQVPQPALETGHPGKIPARRPRPLRTPFERFERTVRPGASLKNPLEMKSMPQPSIHSKQVAVKGWVGVRGRG